MKGKLLVFLLALPFFTLAQVLTIPDSNFKLKLLQATTSNGIAKNNMGNAIAIDSNQNGEIEVLEALQVFQLDVNNQDQPINSKIVSLSGITHFSNLRRLNCNANLLTNLSLADLSNLTHLACKNNQLSALDISALSQLQWLEGQNNYIANLVVGNCPALVSINLANNNLENFSTQGLSGLTQLNLNNNPLTQIHLEEAPQLNLISLSQTQLQEVNACLLRTLSVVDLSHNLLLQQLFLKNGSFESGLNLTNTPLLSFICTDDHPVEIASVQFIVNSNSGSSNCVINSYCSFVPGGETYSIKGTVRWDSTANGCNVSDTLLPKVVLQLIPANQMPRIYGTSASGTYAISVNTGNYTLIPQIEHPEYFDFLPLSSTVQFPGNSSPFTQDFCLRANGDHADLEIVAFPIQDAVPGYATTYKLICKNNGTQVQSAIVTWNFNPQVVTIETVTPAASWINSNQLRWDIDMLEPFETREFTIVHLLQTPLQTPGLNAGDVLTFTGQVEGMTDADATDNIFELKQSVVNSFDPNYKFCLEGTSISTDKIGDYVHYMIRFENLGTANARNVVISDSIDQSKLDLSSLIVLDASHPYDYRITQGNLLEFIFENINLPFNDAENDGYVLFKIKTKSILSNGDSFSNSASIYFDFNSPILTNSYTTIVEALSTPELDIRSVQIAPNPINDYLDISSDAFTKAEIYDFSGRLLMVKSIQLQRIVLSELATGHYILRLKGNTTQAVVRFQKL